MEYKERFLMYADICERAEKEFPDIKQRRMSNMMDIESADKAFNLELEEWLKADCLENEVWVDIPGYENVYLISCSNSLIIFFSLVPHLGFPSNSPYTLKSFLFLFFSSSSFFLMPYFFSKFCSLFGFE